MPTYYVRTDGSDSNNGLGPASNQAWVSIGKALGATGISSGDTVYIAPGRYYEIVTAGLTSPTSETRIIGNPTASQFSGVTAGIVRWTAYQSDTSDDTNTPNLSVTSKDYLTFENLYIESNARYTSAAFNFTTCKYIKIRNCIFIQGGSNGYCLTLTAPAAVGSTSIFDRNIFISKGIANINVSGTGSTNYDMDITIANNLSLNLYSGYNLYISGTYGGGVQIFNNTVIGGSRPIKVDSVSNTTHKIKLYNNLVSFANNEIVHNGGTNGVIVGDYNRFNNWESSFYQYTQGTNDTIYGPSGLSFGAERLFGIGADDFFAPTTSSINLAAGEPNGTGVTITAGNPVIPVKGVGQIYYINDRIQFTQSLGNINSSSVYVVSAAYGTTSFALNGLTPDTSGTVTHRRYRYTSDLYNTGWATTTQPNVGNIEKFNFNTIGYYNPTEKSNTDYKLVADKNQQSINLYLGATGISYNSTGLTAYYIRQNSIPVAIGLTNNTPSGSWISGGFGEISSLYTPGLYRLDLPDAVSVSGVDNVNVVVKGAVGTNGAYVNCQIMPILTNSSIANTVWTNAIRTLSATGLSAYDVWNFNNRTLSAASGATAFEIWNYANRTLSATGLSAYDIWNYTDRIITGGTGVSITQSFPENFEYMLITNTGRIYLNKADIQKIKT